MVRIQKYTLLVFTLIGFTSFISCKKPGFVEIKGETMGTYYQMKYAHSHSHNFQVEIDSILMEINQEMSTYIPGSYISLFNRSKGGLPLLLEDQPLKHFEKNFQVGLEVFQQSRGFFDPTVMPLVNYWGFGYSPKQKVTQVDSVKIDSLLQYVGMEKTILKVLNNQKTLLKTKENVQLDFSAIAKGYAVDVISIWLEKQEVSDYLVEIGGEVRTAGLNAKKQKWILGINTPRPEASPDDIQRYVQLSNASMASSGNYRNFYTENGRIISHTINPKTGLPERTNLLAVSVISEECMYADAYATACMVLGLKDGLQLIENEKNVEACFFYVDEGGEIKEEFTENFKKYLLE